MLLLYPNPLRPPRHHLLLCSWDHPLHVRYPSLSGLIELVHPIWIRFILVSTDEETQKEMIVLFSMIVGCILGGWIVLVFATSAGMVLQSRRYLTLHVSRSGMVLCERWMGYNGTITPTAVPRKYRRKLPRERERGAGSWIFECLDMFVSVV